ncbi:MAG: Veg family protein [Clostridia bacterium]|nr:Veg family protein [Clostridia bacterium]
MIKNHVTVSQVKDIIKNLTSKKVQVKLNLGRNKFVSFYGVLTGVYPALFTITPIDDSFKGKTSYSYSEYMCGKVQILGLEN